MIELVVPDSDDGGTRTDDRLKPSRELVGRTVYTFDGALEEALSLAEELSQTTGGAPVLVNDVKDHDDDTRIVDVYMHRDGRQMSVSRGVERPRPA